MWLIFIITFTLSKSMVQDSISSHSSLPETIRMFPTQKFFNRFPDEMRVTIKVERDFELTATHSRYLIYFCFVEKYGPFQKCLWVSKIKHSISLCTNLQIYMSYSTTKETEKTPKNITIHQLALEDTASATRSEIILSSALSALRVHPRRKAYLHLP